MQTAANIWALAPRRTQRRSALELYEYLKQLPMDVTAGSMDNKHLEQDWEQNWPIPGGRRCDMYFRVDWLRQRAAASGLQYSFFASIAASKLIEAGRVFVTPKEAFLLDCNYLKVALEFLLSSN